MEGTAWEEEQMKLHAYACAAALLVSVGSAAANPAARLRGVICDTDVQVAEFLDAWDGADIRRAYAPINEREGKSACGLGVWIAANVEPVSEYRNVLGTWEVVKVTIVGAQLANGIRMAPGGGVVQYTAMLIEPAVKRTSI
jgi:hypothetical protein